MKKEHITGIIVIVAFFAVVAYFFISSRSTSNEIPPYVSEDIKAIYEWARTEEGKALLVQIPCYCGCKYEGHKNTYNCYWTDEGKFDKHGITCSVCYDIAKKTKEMHEQGKDVCEIRKTIDKFYEPNKHLATDTPMPEGCI